jgi:hypothetical protein
MSGYKVDKNVPIDASYRTGRKSIYPWSSMEVGDSFFVSDETGNPKAAAKMTTGAFKRTGHRFSYRMQDGGVRIWRTF